jgi:uncharacterized iron-regulated membrane protein
MSNTWGASNDDVPPYSPRISMPFGIALDERGQMKLSAHAFTRFWDLHAWAGVLGGLVLYVMFFMGAITLFHGEIETWQEPLAQQAPLRVSHQALFERALAKLPAEPEDVWFHPQATGAAQLGYADPKTGSWRRLWIDGSSGELIPARERLADFLYNLHFLWHEVTGDWLYRLSGFLAIAFLLAIVTGVLIHLKDIVRQFHQFRPEKSRRVLWSDMHKVFGVMGLPFQLMYGFTGALIVLAPLMLGAFVGPVFGGDEKRAETALWGTPAAGSETAGARAVVLPLDELAARARAAEPRLLPESYRVRYPGHKIGAVGVQGPIRGTTPEVYGEVRLRLVDGTVLHVDSPASETATSATWQWVRGLHYAHFGGLPLRLLFFVLALATCATILTGNWVWLARREARRESPGNRWLAGLTAGVGGGTVVATAVLFLVSRLLPFDFPDRGRTEEIVFVGVFVLCLVWACSVENRRALWWQGLGLAGVLLAPVPLLAARWSPAGLFGSGPSIPAVVGVDVAILSVAFALCGAAVALRRAAARATSAAGPAESDASDIAEQSGVLARAGGHDG